MRKTENTKKYATFYMDLKNVEKLEETEKNTGAKKSAVVNLALREYFARRGEENKNLEG